MSGNLDIPIIKTLKLANSISPVIIILSHNKSNVFSVLTPVNLNSTKNNKKEEELLLNFQQQQGLQIKKPQILNFYISTLTNQNK
jgi:hypothetical protein